jgi:hypothetical protein
LVPLQERVRCSRHVLVGQQPCRGGSERQERQHDRLLTLPRSLRLLLLLRLPRHQLLLLTSDQGRP